VCEILTFIYLFISTN